MSTQSRKGKQGKPLETSFTFTQGHRQCKRTSDEADEATLDIHTTPEGKQGKPLETSFTFTQGLRRCKRTRDEAAEATLDIHTTPEGQTRQTARDFIYFYPRAPAMQENT